MESYSLIESMDLVYIQSFVLLQSVYYIFIRNRYDFLLLFVLSTYLYHWQIIYGEISLGSCVFPVNDKSIYILFIILLVAQVATFINDKYAKCIPLKEYRVSIDGENKNIAYIMLVISYGFTLLALVLAGPASLAFDKSTFTRAHGLSYNFVLFFPVCLSVIYGVIAKNRLIVSLSVFPLLIYLVVGYRASLAVVIASLFICVNYDKKIVSIRGLVRVAVLSLCFAFFVVYKFSYMQLKSGDFGGLLRFFSDDLPYVMWAFFSAEWGQIASNLVLTSSIDLSGVYDFSETFLGTISGLNRLLDIDMGKIRFSGYIREYANPGFSYGLGGQIWGEMFQTGGYLAVALMAIVTLVMIVYMNLMYRAKKESVVYFLYYLGFLSFYVHRNDFTLYVGNLKNILFLLLGAYLLILFVKGKIRVGKNVKRLFVFSPAPSAQYK